MAGGEDWRNTHSITVKNAKGTNTIIRLQQYLETGPPTVKKLAITKEPQVNFAFSNDYGEGVLSMWTTLTLVNNYDDDLLAKFKSTDERNFRLLILINGVELFRGFLDFKWNDEDIIHGTTMFEFQATFHNGFSGSENQDIEEIITAIEQEVLKGKSWYKTQDTPRKYKVPIADLWGEFIFEKICGYNGGYIVISHDWASENWRGPGASFNTQLGELSINPDLGDWVNNRQEWYRAICRTFAIQVGFAWSIQKTLLQDVRKGATGSYTGNLCQKVGYSPSFTYWPQTAGYALNEQVGLQITKKNKPKRSFKRTARLVVARDHLGQTKYEANTNSANKLSDVIIVDIPYSPIDPNIQNTFAMEVLGEPYPGIFTEEITGEFKGHYSVDPSKLHSIWKANALAQASYSRMINSYNFKIELNDLIDPMLPIKIDTMRYRACKGRLNTLAMTTIVEESTLISEDYSNIANL